MKKVYALLTAVILCTFCTTSVLQAQYYTVPTCSTPVASNNYGPMNSDAAANSTNRTAVIYPSSQLTPIAGQTIMDIYFLRNATGSAMLGSPNFKIYLKEVAATDWGGTALDWATAITGATLVYDGDPTAIVGTDAGWKEFPLSPTFTYSGTQNLAVFFEYTNPSASNLVNWTYEYTAPCISTSNSNTTKYSNNATGTLPTSLASTDYRRPFIAFDVLLTCYPPTAITVTAPTTSTATVNWTAPTPAPSNGYEYYYNTSSTAPTAGTTPSGTTGAGVLTANLSGLSSGSVYYVWVRSNCGGGDISPWSAATTFFTTPTNDECATATPLTQGATCVNTAGTTAGATLSMAAAPCAGNPDDDVWYSFVATATDAQITLSSVTAVIGSSTDIYFQVLAGACGALTSRLCSDPNSAIVGNLTIGETYYIRVYMYGAASTTGATFNICVNEVAAAPATCGTLSSPANAAQVSTTPTLSWSAVTNASGYEIYLDANNPPTTLYATVYNSNTTSLIISPALSSGTYYWYVVPINSLGAPTGCDVNTRSFVAVAPPVNDDCANATVLIAASGPTCTTTPGSTIGATASTETATTCSATGVNDDVWYSFVATSTTHTVSLSGTSSTSAASIYSGSCGGLVLVSCASTNATATGLTIGNTYYVRVYTTSAVVTTTSNFNICITAPSVNDECAGALNMPLTTYGNACTYTAVNTTGATMSTTTGQLNTCTGTGIDDDIWYTFTSTNAGPYAFSYTGLTATSGTASTVGMNLYTGACGALTEVASACNTGFGSGGTGSVNLLLAANTTYTLRLWVGSSPNTGTFNFCITAAPANPANDECAGSISLTPSAGTNCTAPIPGTTVGATQSANTAPTCSGTGINDDVWYSFVATSTSHTVLVSNATSTTAAALYSGGCGGLTQVSCATGGATSNGLTIGATYYVRVYTTSTVITTYSDFDICVITGGPANDECGGSIPLPTPSATNSCAATLAGSTQAATASNETAPTCSATGTNDDVWYSFVATSTIHAVLISNATNTTAAAIYSGSCGALTQVACGSGTDGSALATTLVIGNTYYVRVYSTSTVVGTYSDFDICVVSVVANDECTTAVPLTVSTTNACNAAVAGSTLGATASTETAPSCSATGTNDDVWYSFVATATTHTVALLNTTTTMAAAVYSGSCGALTQVASACASTNTVAAGLTIGNTYYVRVFSTSTTAGLYGNFNICIGVLPSNDNCAGAMSLVASAGITCNAVAGSTIGSTASTETAPTSSATGTNDDVWYSFVAAATTQIVSLLNTSTTTAAAIYSGACGSLVHIACGSTVATATGLVVGNTYYVRVYSTSTTAGTFSNFDICVTGPPTNDECATATTLVTGVTVGGSTSGATQTMAPEICNGVTASSAIDVWYQFTALQNGTATINVTNVASTLDVVVQVYSGSCGAYTSIGCADGPGLGGSETVVLNGLIGGQTYYVRVFGFTAGTGTFDISVSGAAVPIGIEFFRGRKQASQHLLEWKINCTSSPSATMEIERSADGRNFSSIYTLTATAVRCLQPFGFTDPSALPGINYYRLKTVDVDGRIAYSHIIALLNNEKGFAIVNLVPNPVKQSTILSITSAISDKAEVSVMDITGRKLSTQVVTLIAGNNQVQMNMAKLAGGIYNIVVLSKDGQRKTIQFVKE